MLAERGKVEGEAGVRTVCIDVRKLSSPRCRRMPIADGTILVGTVLMVGDEGGRTDVVEA